MKKTYIYFGLNILLSIFIPFCFDLLLSNTIGYYFNQSSILLALIPGIFFRIAIENISLLGGFGFFIIPYIAYYIFFIISHFYILKLKKDYIGYIFTFLISFLNLYFGYQSYLIFSGI